MDRNLVYGIVFIIILAVAGIAVLLSNVNLSGINGINGTNGIDGLGFNVTVPYTFLFNGSQGIQGIQGEIGLTGSQGIQGIQGLGFNVTVPYTFLFNGSQGIQGIQGEIGLTGSQGIQGIQGVQGVKGDIGSSGLVSVSSPLLNSSGVLSLDESSLGLAHGNISDWGTYINQALLTSSSPSFNVLTANGYVVSGYSLSSPTRVLTTQYKNTAGYDIIVYVTVQINGNAIADTNVVGYYIGSSSASQLLSTVTNSVVNQNVPFSFVVPKNYYYEVNILAGSAVLEQWFEAPL
jgi:hypothetical protein